MKSNLLKTERELRGWSQSKIAELLGTTAKTVGRWERGEAVPYPHYREQLCILFGKSAQQLGWLLDEEHEEKLKTQDIDEEHLAKQDLQVIATKHPSLLPSNLTDPSFLIDPAISQALEKPHSLLGRQHLLAQIKQRLFGADNLALTALNSLPGIGKTALALAVATDRQVQAYFDDGILWARLGPHPNALGQLIRWGTLLGVTPSQVENVKSPQAWGQALRATIHTHRLLIIIEDAWTAEDAIALQIGSPTCTHLLTTHLPQVAQAFAEQHSIVIPPLEETDALALLAGFIPQLIQQDPKRSQALVRALNCLPLALTLMGKYLASQTPIDGPQLLQAILTHLHQTEQRLCVSRASIPEELPLNLVDTMPLSLHATIVMCDQYLSTQAHSALCSLSIFASKPDSFSKEAVLAISQQPVETLDELLDAGLLEIWGPEHYTLHQTIADYIQAQPKALARYQPLSHAVVEDIKRDPPSPLSSTDQLFSPQPLQNIALDHRNNEPTVQPSHRLLQFPALIVSTLFLCVFLITGLLILNRLPFSSNAVSTTYSLDDSTQGIGTNEFNYPPPQTNDKGFTFNFIIGGVSSNHDGWCTLGSDSKTFNCTLDFDKKQIALSTSAGNGSDMMHGSSSPLYSQQLPYCWPSWFPDNPNGKNDLYTYYCGFFSKNAQHVAPRKTTTYTYTFTSEGTGLNHDGWCKQLSSNTFQCILDNGNENNVHLPKDGGTGNSRTDPSPTPLYDQQLPYCWPSWFSLSSSATPAPSTAPGPYDYYCGFFRQ